MDKFIITSWDFASGKAVQNDLEGLTVKPDNWYHCQRDAIGLKEWLELNGLPEAIASSMLTNDTRPRFEEFGDDCFLIILRGINLNKGQDPDDMLSLRILWYKGAIISTRTMSSTAVSALIEEMKQGRGPQTLPDLLLAMVDGINSIISDFLSPVEDRIDDMEDQKDMDIKELNSLYARLLRLRRYLKPQRYVFEDLLEADLPLLQSSRNHFKNALDTIARMNESIEFYIDQIDLYLSNVDQKQAEVMNRNTYLFSVIAGIFLPAGFFTGLLGVNIGGIPGTENPWAFPVFCLALILVVALEVLLLKRLKFI